MKTYKQFSESVALAIPAAARLAPYVLPAIGAAANILKAQGDTAKPRTPNVQRAPDMSPAARQRRQAQQDRRAEAAERNRERAEQGIDSLIGSDAERKAAAQARANQPQIQRQLRQQAMRERMRKAAEAQGLD